MLPIRTCGASGFSPGLAPPGVRDRHEPENLTEMADAPALPTLPDWHSSGRRDRVGVGKVGS